MNIVIIAFYFFEVLAAVSALGILLVRNVFHGALLLVTCLLSLAGLYVIGFAEFVAITQILVYVGGVLILILFGIMVTSRIAGRPVISKNRLWITGIIPGVIILGTLIKFFSEVKLAEPNEELTGRTLEAIGISFMTEYLLQFEVAGVLLLVVLIGATITASMAQQKDKV